VIADRVTDAAAEVHNIEKTTADHLALIAAIAASELAGLVRRDDEAASTAAALVLKAVSDAAAVTTAARAHAASIVAQAAADAAADVAEEAASNALAAESGMITDALDRHQDALTTCYQVATAAANAALTHQSGTHFLEPQHLQPAIPGTPE
jgi:hypothetical protein